MNKTATTAAPGTRAVRHLIDLDDLSRDEIEALLALADDLRGKRTLSTLAGKTLVLLFFDPSLRTRVSMEIAARELGAHSVVLQPGKDTWTLETAEGVVMDGGATEHVKEAVRVLARYGDLIGVRAFPKRQSWDEDRLDPVLSAFARHSEVPVLNLESALYHPCQALADIYTIRRALGPKPGKVVLTWANHPKALPTAVPNSFALAVTKFGFDLTIAHPKGYDLPPDVVERCRKNAARAGSRLKVTEDREAAFAGARVVYAKSWGRIDMYGRTDEELVDRKARGLSRWIVDDAVMRRTDKARFMHCLPIRRNVVATDEVIDAPTSIIFDQSENRLHVQKAILTRLLAAQGS